MLRSCSLMFTVLLASASTTSMAQVVRLPPITGGSSCNPTVFSCNAGNPVCPTIAAALNPLVYQGCLAGQDPATALRNALAAYYGYFPQCVSSSDPNVSSFNSTAPYAQYTDPVQNPKSKQVHSADGTSAMQNGFTVSGQALVCLNPAYGINNPTTGQSATPAMIFVCTASGVTPGSTATSVNTHVDCGPEYDPNIDPRFPTPGYAANNTHAVIYGLMGSRNRLNVNYSGLTQGSSVFSGFKMDLSNPHLYLGPKLPITPETGSASTRR